jgi:Tfp pilus assembly protein PilF
MLRCSPSVSPVRALRKLLCEADQSNDGAIVFRVAWSRILAFALTVFAASFLLLSAAGWFYFTQMRGLRDVAYTDMLWPSGWSRIRIAIGNQAITEAERALSRNEIGAALRLYRIGLGKAPRNADARLALAKLYVESRRPDLARDLLISGLPALADHAKYLELTLGFLLEFQFDAELQRIAEQLTSHPTIAVRRQAALHAAAVAFHRGDFDSAENILVAHQLLNAPQGRLLLARADFERGFPELALARLTPALDDGPAQTAALALAGRIHEQLGHRDELARNAALRLADDPLSPAPRLAVLQQLHSQKKPAELARAIDDYVRLFPHDQAALLALGDFAAHTGQPELARRVQQLFAQHRWSPDAPALLFAEACIAASRYADGLAELDRRLQDHPAGLTRYGPAIFGLRTVALFALRRDDEALLQLEHLLAQPNLRAENLSAVATRLLAFDRPASARTVLARAVVIDPRNQAALAALVRLEAELGQFDTLPGHLRQLLSLRRPSRDVLAFVHDRLGSDLNLLHPEQPALLAELRARLGRDVALTSPKR